MATIYALSQKVFWVIFFIVEKVLFDLTVENRSGLDLAEIKGPYIVASNHKRRIDPFVIGLAFPLTNKIYPIRFMTADGFLKIPILAQYIRLMGGFPTYYKQGIDKSLDLPIKILKGGVSVGYFPEGSMNRSDVLKEAKRGVAVLAFKSKAPILPVAVKYNGFNKVKVTFGAPFFLPEVVPNNPHEPKIDSYEDMKRAAQVVTGRIGELLK
ncbi:MAG: 1-acyl-sn-glycerol-3-phosphate acyltransferase [Parcubacteria group bacterium]|nr:1-acyl-sn-glycerol-3-phosphate acyltransferase [Parcubacteria group bacterium]MCR4342651.1 1-acyl-sn-glycerol-3-phosphate acyltransferase [Patescibacteria group bacterium]